MKVTSITSQTRDKNRVNISIDGKYRFSLYVSQLVGLGIKIGKDYDESEIQSIEQEGLLGKIYARAVEYCFIRPHSSREVKDYLRRKTMPSIGKDGVKREGISIEITSKVFDILVDKGHVDDAKFARYWVENRSLRKGISNRKLVSELSSKGVDSSFINEALSEFKRDDLDEIKKIIAKKRSKYPDDNKFIAYLARLGFNFDTIKTALSGK